MPDSSRATFRLHHLNYNGIKLGKDADSSYFMDGLNTIASRCSLQIFSYNELNVNINIPKIKHVIHTAIKHVLPISSYHLTHSPDSFDKRWNKPAGNAIIVADHWTHRVIDKGSDKIGRWTYVTRKITFISAYRVPFFS